MATFWVDDSEMDFLGADLIAHAEDVEAKAPLIVRKTGQDTVRGGQSRAAVDTGAMRSSVSADVSGLTVEVGPTVEYGHFVELGTSKMSPQPFMGPTADVTFPAAEKAFRQLVATIL